MAYIPAKLKLSPSAPGLQYEAYECAACKKVFEVVFDMDDGDSPLVIMACPMCGTMQKVEYRNLPTAKYLGSRG